MIDKGSFVDYVCFVEIGNSNKNVAIYKFCLDMTRNGGRLLPRKKQRVQNENGGLSAIQLFLCVRL